MAQTDELKQQIEQQIEQAKTIAELEEIRVAQLGKSGAITQMMKQLGQLTGEERKEQGQILNEFKNQIVSCLEAKKEVLEQAELEKKLAS